MFGVAYFKDGKFEGKVGATMSSEDGARRLAEDWTKFHAGIHEYRPARFADDGSLIDEL